jgi:hypothetical protein
MEQVRFAVPMSEPEQDNGRTARRGTAIAIGLAAGVGVGVALDNLASGIGSGLAVGIAADLWLGSR